MLTLKQNDIIGNYTVNYIIKNGTYNGTYRVSNTGGQSFFMKFYDVANVPEKMLVKGEVMEIVHSRRVHHDNVISHVEDGTVSIGGRTYQYIITDFLRGSLLSDIIDKGKTFSPEESKSIITGILVGLDYIHSLNFNHNDLTPRNVILDESTDGKYAPKIIDLGHLCPSVGGIPPFPVNDLNLLYCAPETLAGFFGEAADAFSAMAVMYTMLTGKAPWPCSISENEAYAVKKQKVRTARKEPLDTDALRAAGADDNLVSLIEAGLCHDSNKRPALVDLIRGIAGEDVIKPIGSDKGSAQASSSIRREEDPQQAAVKAHVEIKKAEGGGFADVAGMESLKAELTNRVIWVLRDKEKAEKYRLSPPNGMILYGPPGCGKTFFAEKFAEESKFNFVLVNGSDLGSIYVHGTQGKIADLFREAEKKAPTILCFDEFDSFVPSRSSTAAEHRPEEVNEFLGQLNNCSKKGIFVIGTTNRIDLIDPAVLRKGRMDLHIEIPAPDEKTRSLIFGIHLKDRPLSDDVDTAELALKTDNYAAADIAFIVNEAAMAAALADEPISQKHLLNSIASNKSSLPPKETRRKIGF